MVRELMEKLFESWKGPGRINRSLLADNFRYVSGSDFNATEIWLDSDNGEFPLDDAKITSIAVETCSGSLVFEFTDPVTLLKHRTTWKIKIKGNLISELVEVDERIF